MEKGLRYRKSEINEGYFSGADIDTEDDILDEIQNEGEVRANLGTIYKYCLVFDIGYDGLRNRYMSYGLTVPAIVSGLRKRRETVEEIISQCRIFSTGKYEIGGIQYYDSNNRGSSVLFTGDIPDSIDLKDFYPPQKERRNTYNTNHSSEFFFFVYFNEAFKLPLGRMMTEINNMVFKAGMLMKFSNSSTVNLRFYKTEGEKDEPKKDSLGMRREFGWYSNWGMNNAKVQLVNTYNTLFGTEGDEATMIKKEDTYDEIRKVYKRTFRSINPGAVESLVNKYSEETYPGMAKFRLTQYIEPSEKQITDRIYDSMNMCTAAFAFIIEPGKDSGGKVPISVIEDSILRVLIYTLPKLMLSVCHVAIITKTTGGGIINDKEEERKQLRKEKNVTRLDDTDLLNKYGEKGSSIYFTTKNESFWIHGASGFKTIWKLREANCETRHQERMAMWLGDKNGKVAKVPVKDMRFSGDMRALEPYLEKIDDGTIWN